MQIENDIKLDFCDVLIKPKRSTAPSRSSVKLVKNYKFLHSAFCLEGIPIIAANLDTVGTIMMAKALSKLDMFTALHKYYTVEQLVRFYQDTSYPAYHAFYTIGLKDEDLTKLQEVSQRIAPQKITRICIDVANGYTAYFVDYVKKIRDLFPQSIIMAGNVATPEMVSELLISGKADIVKIGIGPGGFCTTRIKTGVGYPQLSAIIECADAAHGLNGHVCADGGCVEAGDVCKAFGAGADFVMLGTMLTGHDECEVDYTEDVEGNKAANFYGMSSEEANNKYNGGLSNYKAAEGRCAKVEYKGSVERTVQEITGGLRSACTLTGADSLKALPKCTTFVRVNRTHNTYFEKR
jgi:GMP reductase